jgi:hypothetical protein
MNKDQILGLIRHVLTFVGGFLITKGIIDEATSLEAIGAITTLIGSVWSVLSKKPVTTPV